jgi:hypothetical protein
VDPLALVFEPEPFEELPLLRFELPLLRFDEPLLLRLPGEADLLVAIPHPSPIAGSPPAGVPAVYTQ